MGINTKDFAQLSSKAPTTKTGVTTAKILALIQGNTNNQQTTIIQEILTALDSSNYRITVAPLSSLVRKGFVIVKWDEKKVAHYIANEQPASSNNKGGKHTHKKGKK